MTLNEAIELLEDNGYIIVEGPNVAVLKGGIGCGMTFDFKDKMDEDFSIGVGAPCGLDQGIPHGGDCKGCAPVRMGLWQRSPFSANPFYQGVPDAHHPDYWLNQITKKKKKKKKKIRKLREE